MPTFNHIFCRWGYNGECWKWRKWWYFYYCLDKQPLFCWMQQLSKPSQRVLQKTFLYPNNTILPQKSLCRRIKLIGASRLQQKKNARPWNKWGSDMNTHPITIKLLLLETLRRKPQIGWDLPENSASFSSTAGSPSAESMSKCCLHCGAAKKDSITDERGSWIFPAVGTWIEIARQSSLISPRLVPPRRE